MIMRIKYLVLLFGIMLCTGSIKSQQKIITDYINYKDGDVKLEGYIAYDGSLSGERPAIIVVHDWMGVGDFVKEKCDELARLGYFAFAADIYGKESIPKSKEEAAKQSSIYKQDRELMRRRINIALEELKKNKLVLKDKIASIGYCFGGTVSLELARSGADIKGAVSFHGGLETQNLNEAKNIKSKVLVLHGADDPFVPEEQVNMFQKEMRDASVDLQFISYSGAVHSFTNPKSGNDNSKGAAYNEKADKRSWKAMKLFFDEIFN